MSMDNVPEAVISGRISPHGHMEGLAIQTAHRQKRNEPWWCSKLRTQVTNTECRANKREIWDRACRDCGIPNILPKEGPMAMKTGNCTCGQHGVTLYGSEVKGWWCYRCWKQEPWKKAKQVATPPAEVVPVSNEVALIADTSVLPALAEPSWDDFEPVTRRPISSNPRISINKARDRINFNAAAQRILGWEKQSRIQVRVSADRTCVAFRLTESDEVQSYSLTAGGKSSIMGVACKAILGDLAPDPGVYHLSITSWGCIAHLDRPVADGKKYVRHGV